MRLKSRTRALFLIAPVAAMLGSFAVPSQAALFDMALTATGGIQAPAGPFYGSFELPGYTGVGDETFSGSGQILGFNATITATVNGAPFTMTFQEHAVWSDFEIRFVNGNLNSIVFLSALYDPFDLEISGRNWSSLNYDPGDLVYEGTVDVSQVPLPAALQLFAAALGVLAGAGAWHRRGSRTGHI